MATATSRSTNRPATTATCCLRNLRRNSLHGVRTGVAICIGAPAARVAESAPVLSATTGCARSPLTVFSAPGFMCLAIADGRVDHGVEHVDHQIDQDELEGEKQDLGLDDRVVAHVDGVDQQAAHAGPVEDYFDDDRSSEQKSELKPHHGDHGDERIAQSVLD